jgi:hypothetical protein
MFGVESVSSSQQSNGSKHTTAENFMVLLERLRQRQPFRVFSVELHGGERFEVDHPGAVIARDGMAIFLALGGVPHWFDHDSVLHITE